MKVTQIIEFTISARDFDKTNEEIKKIKENYPDAIIKVVLSN